MTTNGSKKKAEKMEGEGEILVWKRTDTDMVMVMVMMPGYAGGSCWEKEGSGGRERCAKPKR